jgi:multisubunit Na+/H+ antiporter MnhE subunit
MKHEPSALSARPYPGSSASRLHGKAQGSFAPMPKRRVVAWLAWWVLLMSFWVIVDDSLRTDELLAGAGAAALGATLAEVASNQAGVRVRVRPEWLGHALRLPAQVGRDTWIVFAALWRQLAHGQPPRSTFCEIPVARAGDDSARNDADAVTRRVLQVWSRSLPPNSFALGIEPERDVMIVHQLVPAGERDET